MMAGEVFISYERNDRSECILFKNALENLGLRVWIDTKDINLGDNWREAISNAISQSACLLVLASPTAYLSIGVNEEIDLAKKNRIECFVVLVKGDLSHVPRRLLGRQYERLSMNRDEPILAVEKRIAEIALGIKTYVEQPHSMEGGSGSPVNPTPFPYEIMRAILKQLVQAANFLDTVDGRAALYWVRGEELYVVAATTNYEEAELRARYERGKGIIGYFWQKLEDNRKPSSHPVYPQTLEFLSRRDNFRLERFEADLLTRTELIVGVSVFHDDLMVGMLVVDILRENSASASNRNVGHEIFSVLEDIGEKVGGLAEHNFQPVDYFKGLALNNLIYTARLIPDYRVPVRAGMFWWNETNRYLYMIGNSQRYSRNWDAGSVYWGEGQGMIGMAKAEGKVKWDQRLKPPKIGEYKDKEVANMSFRQFATVWDIRSVVAAPITPGRGGPVIGVLALLSTYPYKFSKFDTKRVQNMLKKFAAIAGQIYSTEVGQIYSEFGNDGNP